MKNLGFTNLIIPKFQVFFLAYVLSFLSFLEVDIKELKLLAEFAHPNIVRFVSSQV